MAVGVRRRERVPVDLRRLADQAVLRRRMDERVDGALEALRRQRASPRRPRPEPGAPEQALGLLRAERPRVDGQGHARNERASDENLHPPADVPPFEGRRPYLQG